MALRFFLGANSKDGFVSLFPRLQQEAPRRLYVVKSGPGCGKSTCISRLSEALGGAEELIFCSSDPDSLDGAVLQDAAILDGTAPHVFEPSFPGCDGDYLPLPAFLDRQGLIIFIPEDEMIKTTAKLDNIMEYKILNKENYARIMEALGAAHE